SNWADRFRQGATSLGDQSAAFGKDAARYGTAASAFSSEWQRAVGLGSASASHCPTNASRHPPCPHSRWRIYNASRRVRGGRSLCPGVACFSPETFGWAAIATLATWLMTLFINRTEHCDTQALHAKLDDAVHQQNRAPRHPGPPRQAR